MKFIKEIRRVGNNVGMFFTRKEAEMFDIKLGDYIDMSDVIVIHKRKRRKKK